MLDRTDRPSGNPDYSAPAAPLPTAGETPKPKDSTGWSPTSWRRRDGAE